MRRETLTNNNDYIEDKPIQEDSPLKTVLFVGGMLLGGVGLYKTGILKGFTQAFYPKVNKATRYAVGSMTEFKKWISKDVKDTSSLVRSKGLGDFKDRLLSTGEYKGRSFADDTLSDINDFKSRFKAFKTENRLRLNQEYELSIFKDFRNLDVISNNKKISQAKRDSASKIKSKDIFLKYYRQEEDLEMQMMRTGFRNLTIGDMFDLKEIEGKPYLQVKHHKDPKKRMILKDWVLDYSIENSIKMLDDMKNIKVYDSKGNPLLKNGKHVNLFESGLWKNMIFDKDMYKDELGNVVDLRNFREDKRKILNSLANDYKIPFVGINPLKFFGIGNLNKDIDYAQFINNETIQPILTGKKGRVSLSDAGLKDLFYSNNSVYKFNESTQEYELFKDNIYMRYVPKQDYKVTKDVSDLGKMAELNLKEFEDFKPEDGAFKNVLKEVADKLDLGKQDRKGADFRMSTYEGILSTIDPNTYIEKFFDKLNEKNIFNNGVKKNTEQTIYESFLSEKEKARVQAMRTKAMNSSKKVDTKKIENIGDNIYIAINKRVNLKNAIDPESNESILGFIKQYIAGRRSLGDVSEDTLRLYYLFERMNQGLGNFGLALSTASTGSTADVIKNLILKRFLPIYLCYQSIQYGISLTEDDDGDNIQKKLSRGVVYTKVGLREMEDKIGLTNIIKKIDQLTPGSDTITELPGIHSLQLGKNAQELAEYYVKGMDPVRKGRLWDLGNSDFSGGKIEYWQPNLYRRIQADADYTDTKYGSRDEYFENAWFPTLTHPFAPIKHFITDRYHYEKKHYYDRPYMLTSSEFNNVPLLGPILSGTIGKVIKPQLKMHTEYYGTDKDPVVKINEDIGSENNINTYILNDSDFEEDDRTISNINKTIDINTLKDIKLGKSKFSNVTKDVSYTTYSGSTSLLDIKDNDINDVNDKLKIGSINGINNVEKPSNYPPSKDQKNVLTEEGAVNNSGLKMSLANQFSNFSEVAGIYGFIAKDFIFGDLGSDQQVIEESGDAYSINDKFWEQEIGGLGGDLSEIGRRFLQKPRRLNRYNPVRNTMGEWLPGDNYFTDYQHGDAYQKISKGEIRLPGEAYRKIWDIKNPYEMYIDSEYLGRSREDIFNKLLNRDLSDESDILLDNDTKNRIIKQQQKEILKSGIGIEKDVKFEDSINNITGSYDLKIKDGLLMNDEAIMKIQPLSDAQFNDVINNGALNQNIKEVNYQLYASGDNRGYIRYVNAATNETKDFIVNKDKEMFDNTIKNLDFVRSGIIRKIQNRELSEDDLYKPLDKLRILADVAPYSNEYKDMLSKVSKNADDETRREVQEIKQRVKMQKKPKRTYEYKFKYADVDTIKTKITKIRGNSIYVDYNGEDRKINLAGIMTSSINKNKEYKDKLNEVRKNIKVGNEVKLKVDADEKVRESTIGLKAVLYDDSGKNINREMVKQGLATWKEKDDSPTSINARFNRGERLLGSIWESISHLDTYVNTKILHVRSAVENYEREEVYGKSFSLWSHPIRDYLMPSVYHNIHRTGGVLIGALVGSLFGRTKYGKAVGALVGGGAIAIGKINAFAYKKRTGEEWIPKPRRKEREMNEYIDILKYLKNMKYFNMYKEKALKEDHFDVDKYLEENSSEGRDRKLHVKNIEKQKHKHKMQYIEDANKRDDYIDDKPVKVSVNKQQSIARRVGGKIYNSVRESIYEHKSKELIEKASKSKKKVSDDNKKIENIKTFRKAEELPNNAIMALKYKEQADKTMYAYDKGDSVQNIMAALPKKDRDNFMDFVNAPKKEREKLLKIAPKYLRRPLESMWGMEVESKTDLVEYFKEHQLPGQDWVGWSEDVDLNNVKVKMINHEGLPNNEFNVWDKDIESANNQGNVPLPHINYKSKARDIRSTLLYFLGKNGIKDTNISYTYGGDGIDIDLDLEYSKKEEVEEKLKKNKL